ncbi:hypothetical protein DLM75_02485 [Leptospira stimsonii]|uniref:Uncharacterized protein n=1 Tax=Leptospira stimsonii TaxID=2202203 RepID=A0A396ZEA3_9LEPT|nr:hypothetical protein DLM75_02485 [Leptospira stimsonii]
MEDGELNSDKDSFQIQFYFFETEVGTCLWIGFFLDKNSSATVGRSRFNPALILPFTNKQGVDKIGYVLFLSLFQKI